MNQSIEQVPTTCGVCMVTYSDFANELNVQGICTDCERDGWTEVPEEDRPADRKRGVCQFCGIPFTDQPHTCPEPPRYVVAPAANPTGITAVALQSRSAS